MRSPSFSSTASGGDGFDRSGKQERGRYGNPANMASLCVRPAAHMAALQFPRFRFDSVPAGPSRSGYVYVVPCQCTPFSGQLFSALLP